MRTFLTIILPLIAPTVAFVVWTWFAKKRAEAEARHQPIPAWQTWPWARLTLAGAVLTALTLSAIALVRPNEPGMRYVPPRMENGELVPGHYEEIEEGEDSVESYRGYGSTPPSLPNRKGDE